jgi:regulator of RNase E activity RraA
MTDTLTHPPTAALADASIRLGLAVQTAPVRLRPLRSGQLFAGPAAPVTHLGSVDVILEAIDDAPPSAVVVIDNGGREDEACVGDLMVLEALTAGLAGMLIWGRHRDTTQLLEIGLPVHSLGAHPFGPRRVPPAGRAMRSAFLDGVPVTPEDWVVADDDGAVIFPAEHRSALYAAAAAIVDTETAQAMRMRAGSSLRSQLDFAGYRSGQASDPSLTLRRHLVERGGAIEV